MSSPPLRTHVRRLPWYAKAARPILSASPVRGTLKAVRKDMPVETHVVGCGPQPKSTNSFNVQEFCAVFVAAF